MGCPPQCLLSSLPKSCDSFMDQRGGTDTHTHTQNRTENVRSCEGEKKNITCFSSHWYYKERRLRILRVRVQGLTFSFVTFLCSKATPYFSLWSIFKCTYLPLKTNPICSGHSSAGFLLGAQGKSSAIQFAPCHVTANLIVTLKMMCVFKCRKLGHSRTNPCVYSQTKPV